LKNRPWWVVLILSLALSVGWHLVLCTLPTDGMVGSITGQSAYFELRYAAPPEPDSQWSSGGVSTYKTILRVGTEPMAIWLARSLSSENWEQNVWQPGDSHRYTVLRRDNGETKVITTFVQRPALSAAALVQYLGVAALSALAMVVAAVVVLRRYPDQPLTRPLILLACGALIGLSWWTFGTPFSYVALGWPYWTQVSLHLIANALTFGAWLHLALTFLKPLPWVVQYRRVALLLIYGIYPAGLFLLTGFQRLDLRVGPLETLMTASAWEQQAAIVLKGLAYVAWGTQYRIASIQQRGQLHWVLAANAAADLPYLVQAISGTNGVLSIVGAWLAILPPIGYLMALMPGRRLRIALQPTSGLIHGITNTLIVALFLCGLGLAAGILTRTVGAARTAGTPDDTILPIVTAVLAVVFALTTAPLVSLLREQLDSWFKGTRGAQRALLHQFTGRVSDEISLENVARAFRETLEQGIQPAFAALWLWNEETRSLYSVLSIGETGQVPKTQAVIGLTDADQQQFLRQSVYAPLDRADRAGDRASSWLLGFAGYVALVSSGKMVGVCAIGPRADGGAYSGDAIRFFETLARSATLAFRNAQLVSQLEDKVAALRNAYQQLLSAQESERRSLASELHDETLQQLAHINLIAGSLLLPSGDLNGGHVANGGNAGNGKQGQQIQLLQRSVITAEQRLREILRGIHPAVLTNLGLIAALEAWLPHPPGVRVTLTHAGFDNRRLPDADLEMTLYRLVQESTNNALQHAQATSIDIRLVWHEAEITLEVADDGIGFEPGVYLANLRRADKLSGNTPANTTLETPTTGHFGLLNLKERVIALNGHLIIDSQPGRGTTIRARLPI
jgi:signal transduction histidine kinase